MLGVGQRSPAKGGLSQNGTVPLVRQTRENRGSGHERGNGMRHPRWLRVVLSDGSCAGGS